MIDFNILLMVLLGAYILKACNIAMGASEAYIKQNFNKVVLIRGLVKQSGFIVGMLIVFLGGVVLPSEVLMLDIGGVSISVSEISFIILLAFATEAVTNFWQKAIELHNIDIKTIENHMPKSAPVKYDGMTIMEYSSKNTDAIDEFVANEDKD